MVNAVKIGEILAAAGYPVGAEAEEKFEIYLRYLTECNAKLNLTSIDSSDAPARHFADSLQAAEFIPDGATVLDIGSGAGFPGVPLKIYRNDIKLTALDSIAKKASFLRSLSVKLGIDYEVICARAEELAAGKLRESYSIAVTRAVAELRVLCEIGLPLIKQGGALICYKGKLSETELGAGMTAAKMCGGKLSDEKRFTLFGSDRCIVVFEKVFETPPEYPRRYKKIISEPLMF